MNEIVWFLKYIIYRFAISSNCFVKEIFQWKCFWKQYCRYKKHSPGDNHFKLALQPMITDATSTTPVEPIYFYQDTWAFEKISRMKPLHHYDVGSQHMFVAFISKIIPVTMVDIRPLPVSLGTINFKKGSILNLPFESETIDSLSSLCVVEHIGLGRYGDELDPLGTEKAIKELKRVVAKNGDLYMSIPVHDENIIFFNAHRAFKEDYLLDLFSPFKLLESKYIFGKDFCNEKRTGFGIGLYHLRNN